MNVQKIFLNTFNIFNIFEIIILFVINDCQDKLKSKDIVWFGFYSARSVDHVSTH